MVISLRLFPALGRDFFPEVDAGQMRLHVRAPPGTRLEETQKDFAAVEAAIRQIVGAKQIDTLLDNIGLPYSGINIALSDSATIGPMDGEILISLKEKHTPTAELMAKLRRELPKRFAGLQFFFQPADIVDQVLNFGAPAPIDIRVSGPDSNATYALAQKLTHDLAPVPGIVDAHVFQVPDAPALSINIDRTLAGEFGLNQQTTASNVLVAANSSAQTMPNFWIDPRNNVSYPLVVQEPTYHIGSAQDLWTLPVTAESGGKQQMLMNVAKFSRGTVPMVLSQYNIRPVFDVNANVQGRDLNSVASEIDKVIEKDKPDAAKGHIGDLKRPGGNHAQQLCRHFFRHGAGRGAGLPVSGYQFPKLDRSADRVARRTLRAQRRDVDALSHANASERPGADGNSDVHRPDHRQLYSRRNLCQSAYGCR